MSHEIFHDFGAPEFGPSDEFELLVGAAFGRLADAVTAQQRHRLSSNVRFFLVGRNEEGAIDRSVPRDQASASATFAIAERSGSLRRAPTFEVTVPIQILDVVQPQPVEDQAEWYVAVADFSSPDPNAPVRKIDLNTFLNPTEEEQRLIDAFSDAVQSPDYLIVPVRVI